ncbi:HdeD family acid-resistance protein [Streptomyces mangrovisoli]|uniref:HdeD family acid-resistance protein n=1 Tax=Streptomyces mangrovisoli TaxID=1428628 RepID=A0A1J4P2B1_9ACTN|nr:DUF308 domain-containing protein [Streptomyces mangrovisoli]OIJ68903.1 hypothetical protein WN71_005440 [Streptomyces mangrovisoli]
MSQPTTPAPADPQDFLADLGDSWIWALGLALATLIPGVVVLVWPEETLHVLAVVIGLHFLVVAVFGFVNAFSRSRNESGGGRLLRALIAFAALVVGVLCLRHPLQTIAVLALVIGLFWLLSGAMTLYIAIADRNLPHRGLVIATSTLGIVAGIVVLCFPVDSAVALARLLGLWLVLLGVAELVMAFMVRSALRRLRSARTGPVTAT